MSYVESEVAGCGGPSDICDPNEKMDDFAEYIEQVF